MAFSICYWANYTQGKTKLSRKSENAVADDRVLNVESSVRCHRKYKNGRIKVDLGQIIFIYLHALYSRSRTVNHAFTARCFPW